MSFGGHYVHGLRGAVNNAQAFAFSIMITSSFGAVASLEGSPGLGHAYVVMTGAVLGFVAVLAASLGFRETGMEAERTPVIVIGSALALGSTAAGLGAATLLGAFLNGYLAWGLAPFAASTAFMLVLALEFAVIEEVEEVEEEG